MIQSPSNLYKVKQCSSEHNQRQRAIAQQLQQCQRSNAALAFQLGTAQNALQARTQNMQQQITAIRGSVIATQRDLFTTNRQLHGALCSAARTTMRLALLYLRMREAQHEALKRADLYEQLVYTLSASVREQAQLLRAAQHGTSNDTSTTDGAVIKRLRVRVGELLYRCADLEVQLAARRLAATSSSALHRNKRSRLTWRTRGKRQLKPVQQQHVGQRPLSRRRCLRLLSDSDVTVFDVQSVLSSKR